MAVYQIYLVKLGNNIGLSDEQQTQVKNKIEVLYNRVIHDDPVQGYISCNVNWSTSCQNVQPRELLVYILRNDLVSVVTAYVNSVVDAAHRMRYERNRTGLTAWAGGKTVSEVYVHGCNRNLDLIAKTVFHESMHYKTHWNDHQLHSRGGLAARRISADTELTRRNIRDMKIRLTHARTPMLNGCQIYQDNSLDGFGSLDRGSSHRYAANQSGPIRGGSAVLHGEVHGGVHQQRVMGFDSDLA